MTGHVVPPRSTAGGRARPGPADHPTSIVAQRAVIVLSTPERHDSRTLRIAATLAGRGHEVTILARRGLDAAAAPENPAASEDPAAFEDSPDGYRIVRVGSPPAARTTRRRGGVGRVLGEVERIGGIGLAVRRQVREAAAADPGADVYHGMAYQGIPIALALAGRARARTLYDARDLYPESGNLARMPAPVRALAGLLERRWARRCDGIITVNDELAAVLAGRFDRPLPAVVMNCPPAWMPPPQPDRRFHARLGLASETRVVLYHGGFLPSRGIEMLATAVVSIPGVVLVAMGDGPLRPVLERRAAEPRAGGRIHLLPPVPPADLLAWIAAADVGAMVNQPVSRNERISTPNKLFECLAAGVPVVSSDFPGRRRIVIDDPDGPLGAVCDPTDPGAIARALREVLDRSAEEMIDLRRRVLAAAHARWTWERQVATLLGVYGRLTGRPW